MSNDILIQLKGARDVLATLQEGLRKSSNIESALKELLGKKSTINICLAVSVIAIIWGVIDGSFFVVSVPGIIAFLLINRWKSGFENKIIDKGQMLVDSVNSNEDYYNEYGSLLAVVPEEYQTVPAISEMIMLFETGRCDTLKEALREMDRRVEHRAEMKLQKSIYDQLVESRQVQERMLADIGEIKKGVRSIDRSTRQIARNTSNIAGHTSSISGNVREINREVVDRDLIGHLFSDK